MASQYTQLPHDTIELEAPQLEPSPYPARSTSAADEQSGLRATSVQFADKTFVTVTRGSRSPGAWFHAALPESDTMDPAFRPFPANGEDWEPSVMIDVKTLLGVGASEDNGRFIAGLVAKEVTRKRLPIGGVMVGVGVHDIKGEEWEIVTKLVQEIILGT